jgi:hypothetical protein
MSQNGRGRSEGSGYCLDHCVGFGNGIGAGNFTDRRFRGRGYGDGSGFDAIEET